MITLFAAVFQRLTGPSYPLRGNVIVQEKEISYRLPRTHESTSNCPVTIQTETPEIRGILRFRRFKTDDPWTERNMVYRAGALASELPRQPAAGKLEYMVTLHYDGKRHTLSEKGPIVIRFKDPVPLALLIPHVFIMFLAMLFSTRSGLEALDPKGNTRPYVFLTFVFLACGGMILGPLVQKFAFGALWTGFPLGSDLTDTKTLIAFLGWLIAFIVVILRKPARVWVLAASLLLLIVYLIPHSLLGSELDYSRISSAVTPAEKIIGS